MHRSIDSDARRGNSVKRGRALSGSRIMSDDSHSRRVFWIAVDICCNSSPRYLKSTTRTLFRPKKLYSWFFGLRMQIGPFRWRVSLLHWLLLCFWIDVKYSVTMWGNNSSLLSHHLVGILRKRTSTKRSLSWWVTIFVTPLHTIYFRDEIVNSPRLGNCLTRSQIVNGISDLKLRQNSMMNSSS